MKAASADPLLLPPLIGIDPEHGGGKGFQRILRHLRDSPDDPEDVWRFMTFAMPLAGASKAQLFQDLWALWVSGAKRDGYFVEFGAADGVNISNTWFLEKQMGWTGVLAEPNPVFTASLQRERSCIVSTKCVYSTSGQHVGFLAAKHSEFSRVADIVPADQHEDRRKAHQIIQVETISLGDLLAEHQAPECIDYMSIDTEGSELDILQAFDFERWDVRAFTIEHNGTPAREPIRQLLVSKGYRRLWTGLSRFDDWYVRA